MYSNLHFWPAGDPLICVCSTSRLTCGGPDEWGVGASGDGGVAGDFEGADELVEGLFPAPASSEAFEGGHSDYGKESHNADHCEKFDEGER